MWTGGGGSITVAGSQQISARISAAHFENDVGCENVGVSWCVKEFDKITMKNVV